MSVIGLMVRFLCISFGENQYFPYVAISLTLGPYFTILFKREVDDSSVVRIHLPHYGRLAGFFNLLCQTTGVFDKIFLL